MKPWLIPWLFPVGLLVIVVSATVADGDGLLALVAGCLLAAFVWSLLSRAGEDPDADAHYWRLSDWTRGR